MNKVAVIGLGNISKRHRANLKILYPNIEIFAVSASGKQQNKLIDNADFLLASIEEVVNRGADMAIVASPATYHASHAIPLLNGGIPVLIEKPISASVGDAKAIIEAAEKSSTPATVGYCLRYLSSSQKVKTILEEGTIGEIYNVFVEIGQYLPDWRSGVNYLDTVSAQLNLGGGVLLELSHELDYLQWLFGTLIPHSAILRSSVELSLEVEDSADILSVTGNDVVCSIHLDFLQRKTRRKCRVVGSKGCIEWDLLGNRVLIVKENNQQIVFDDGEQDKNQMYLKMLTDFERKIRGQDNQCITLHEAKDTVSLIEKLKELARKR